MFFNPQKYDFSRVGRLKLNTKLKLNTPLDEKILHPQDFYEVIKYLLKLKKNPANVDDIDHLGNRRVRSVGELLENQFRIGLVRMERAIKEKMSVYQEMATAMPHDLINAKPVMAAIREFFGSSQLSQFMDQTNPLSEITHKRRLSALGPGGLSRERAGFEVRDVHPTHYGRICPIETPEGPNIGLISSLSLLCADQRVRLHRVALPQGRERPRRRLREDPQRGRPREAARSATSCRWTTWRRSTRRRRRRRRRPRVRAVPVLPVGVGRGPVHHRAGQRRARREAAASCTSASTRARRATSSWRRATSVQYIDVSPKQLVSVAASLIPFLENDDANRALMGSNMQRQAVPLLRARAPYVGTGMEYITARDSGAVVVARRSGTVDYVDSTRIVVRVEGEGDLSTRDGRRHLQDDEVQARRTRTPASTRSRSCGSGRRCRRARSLADGPCTELGELALGPQRAGRLHAVARLQLRGRDPGVREAGEGGLLHLDPHRGVRDRGPRHEARARGDHARHPERLGDVPARPRRERHHPHRRLREAGRHPGGQGHAEGRDAAHARREAAARDLRREGR